MVAEQVYSSKKLFEMLRAKAKEMKRTPSKRDLEEDKDMPSPSVYQRRFGSYNRACRFAGLRPNPQSTRGSEADETT